MSGRNVSEIHTTGLKKQDNNRMVRIQVQHGRDLSQLPGLRQMREIQARSGTRILVMSSLNLNSYTVWRRQSFCNRFCKEGFHVYAGFVVVEKSSDASILASADSCYRWTNGRDFIAFSSGQPTGNCMTFSLRRLSSIRSLAAPDVWMGNRSMMSPILRRLIRSTRNPPASASRNRSVIESAGGACDEIVLHAMIMLWSTWYVEYILSTILAGGEDFA